MLDNGCCGVLSGRDRKKKLETGLLFEVLLLDQQISFGVRLFFVTRCPHMPLVTCHKAQTWKNWANWGVFPSEDVQLVKRRLCGVDGRWECKNASTVRGELSFHLFLAKEEQRREWIVKICPKNTPLTHTKHLCLWCPLRWRETSRYFSVPARFVWTKPAKKERLSHVSQAARFPDKVEMEVDGNISREAGRLRFFRGSWWIGRSRLFPLPKSREDFFLMRTSWGTHESSWGTHESSWGTHESSWRLMRILKSSWAVFTRNFAPGFSRLLMSLEKCSRVLTNRPLNNFCLGT